MLKKKVMEQTETLSQGQRQKFACLLAEARKRQEDLLEDSWDMEARVKAEFLAKLAEERGASDLIGKVLTLTKQIRTTERDLDTAERDLKDFGFCWSDDDGIELTRRAPKDLAKALEEKQREAEAERQRSLRKFDLAVLNVWAAKSADEAKRIVEELL